MSVHRVFDPSTVRLWFGDQEITGWLDGPFLEVERRAPGRQTESERKAELHPWAAVPSIAGVREPRLHGRRDHPRAVFGPLAARYAEFGRRKRRNRHDARRWLRAFAEVCVVAEDLLIEERRGEAIGVLCELIALEDALRLTLRPGWSDLIVDGRYTRLAGEYLDRVAVDRGLQRFVGETDEQLRARCQFALGAYTVRLALLAVEGVTAAEVHEVAPGEIECVVAGGEDQAVAETIWRQGSAGVATIGTREHWVGNPPSSVRFSRPQDDAGSIAAALVGVKRDHDDPR